MLEGAPTGQVANRSRRWCRTSAGSAACRNPPPGIGKLGRKIYLEVHYLVAEDAGVPG